MANSALLGFVIRFHKRIEYYFNESFTFRVLHRVCAKISALISGSKVVCFICRPERTSEKWHNSVSFRILRRKIDITVNFIKLTVNSVAVSHLFNIFKKSSSGVLNKCNIAATVVFTAALTNLCLWLMTGDYSNAGLFMRMLILVLSLPIMFVKINPRDLIGSSKIISILTGVGKWLYAEHYTVTEH